MLLTMFFFVTLDALAKHLMQHYSVVQVIWARFFFHMIFACLALIVMQTNIRQEITSKKPGLQIVRSLLMLLTNGSIFHSDTDGGVDYGNDYYVFVSHHDNHACHSGAW